MILLESRTKSFYHKSIDTFCFIALTKSVTQNIRGVTGRHCLSKEIFSQQRYIHKLLQSIYFAYEKTSSTLIQIESVTERFLKAAQRMLGSWMGLRTVFENHCSTKNTTPANYDVTALAMIKPEKHQRRADLLLHSGVVTHNNRV